MEEASGAVQDDHDRLSGTLERGRSLKCEINAFQAAHPDSKRRLPYAAYVRQEELYELLLVAGDEIDASVQEMGTLWTRLSVLRAGKMVALAWSRRRKPQASAWAKPQV